MSKISKGSHAAIPQSHNNIDHDDGYATPRLKMLDLRPYTHLPPSSFYLLPYAHSSLSHKISLRCVACYQTSSLLRKKS